MGSGRFWRGLLGRSALYGGALLIAALLIAAGLLFQIRQAPRGYIERALATLPFTHRIGKVEWVQATNYRAPTPVAPSLAVPVKSLAASQPPPLLARWVHFAHALRRSWALQISDVKLGTFFYAKSITLSASFRSVLRHHLESVEIDGGQLFTGPLLDTLQHAPHGASSSLNWVLDRVVIRRATLLLDHLAPGLPAVPFRLGVRSPVVLHYLHLNSPDQSPQMREERTVDLESVRIVSPIDPLASVFYFPLTRIHFTYNELWHHQIREITLVKPILYLGQDLFWLTDQIKKGDGGAAPTAPGPEAPWHIGKFSVRYGQLAINAFGQPAAIFPFIVETSVDDVRLDQLNKITLKSALVIRRLNQDYPDYKVKIVNLSGRVDFSVPPSDAHANNVVPRIQIEELSWNNIAIRNAWSSFTFDPTGIYGRLGGACEGGNLQADFDVYYTKGFTWNANLFASKINVGPIAEKLGGGKAVQLTGQMDGKITVQGRSTEILACTGQLNLPGSGQLEVTSADEMMRRLPANLAPEKRRLLQLAISSLRTYRYDHGQVDLHYIPGGAQAHLKLNGPQGNRSFTVNWHPELASDTTASAAATAAKIPR